MVRSPTRWAKWRRREGEWDQKDPGHTAEVRWKQQRMALVPPPNLTGGLAQETPS